jgi:hypothetical protein
MSGTPTVVVVISFSTIVAPMIICFVAPFNLLYGGVGDLLCLLYGCAGDLFCLSYDCADDLIGQAYGHVVFCFLFISFF